MSASDRWSTQRDVLAVEVLRRCGRLRLRVWGESMLPTLWPGDVAEIEACQLGEVRRGDVVLAFRDDRFFLHRLVARGPHDTFVSRGDAMPHSDPSFPAEACIGKLVAATRKGRPVSVVVRRWSRALGLLFCYCNALRRAALRLRTSADSPILPETDLETA